MLEVWHALYKYTKACKPSAERESIRWRIQIKEMKKVLLTTNEVEEVWIPLAQRPREIQSPQLMREMYTCCSKHARPEAIPFNKDENAYDTAYYRCHTCSMKYVSIHHYTIERLKDKRGRNK